MSRTAEEKVAYVLAIWFGCGLSPIAPGTVGAIGALPIYFAVRGGGPIAIAATAVAITFLGVWASNVLVRTSREKDPQIIVIDEVAGTLIALAAAPMTAAGVVTAVVAFRFFDIAKPPPIRSVERLPRGWGIVLDDVLAGVFAAGVVVLLRAVGLFG